MTKDIFRTHKLAKAATVAVSTICLQLATVGMSTADGRAVVNSWAAEAVSTDVVDVKFGDIHQNGTTVTVTDFEITVSMDEIANVISDIVGKELEADDASSNISYAFKFPTVTFEDLVDDGDRYTVSSISAETMEMVANFKVDQNNEQATTGTYSGFSATNMDWAKLPEVEGDPARPVSQFLPVLRAALDFSFDEMKIDDAVAESSIGPNGETFDVSYGSMLMGKTVRGDISEMVGGPVKMRLPLVDTDSEKPMQTMDMEISSFSASDYDYGSLLDTLFKSGEAGFSDYRNAIGRMAMTGWTVSVPSENVEVTIGDLVMEKIGVRSPTFDWIAFVDEMAAKAIKGEDIEEPNEEELVSLIVGIYGAFSIGKLEISDIDIKGPEIRSGKLASYGLTDLSAAGLGSLYTKGVEFLGEKGEIVKYGESSISDIIFPDIKALMNFEKNVETKNTAEVIKAIPTFGTIINSGIEVVIPEEELDFSLARSEIKTSGHIGPIPTEIDINVDNLALPVSIMDREPREMFSAMGYERVDGSYDMNIKWDEGTQGLNVTLDTALVDGGRLSGSAALGSIPRIVFEKPDESAIFSLLATTFKNLNLRYDDNSLVERGFQLAAQQQGTDATSMKAQVQGILPVVLSQLGDAELAASVSAAVKGLIEDGKSLSLSAVAATPLPVVALGTAMQSNPASILKSLQIDVGNN